MIMADNNENKVLNVPHLRFPEFTDEWGKYKLSDVCSFFSGGTPSSSKKEYYDGSIPFIRSGELHMNKTELFITEEGLNNSAAKMVEIGDLLLALYGATSGDIAIGQIKGAINQAILCIRTTQNKKFIESVWKKHVEKLLQTYLQGGQGNLSADIVKNISFYFANSSEQMKLAKFISLLDERIATQNKIIKDLKKLKSAIVDRLYSSINGETYSFHQLFEVANEKNKKLIYKNVLSASQELGMIERSDINIDIKFEQDSISGYKIVRNGDYVVHLRSFQGGFAFSDRTGICSPAYTILRPNDLVGYGYLSHFFTSKLFIKSLKLVTYGIRDGRSINVDEWLNMTVTLPNIQEQVRILTIINAIDAKLHIEIKKQSCLFRQKSYLLNTMFI